jgi:hypothetical protein
MFQVLRVLALLAQDHIRRENIFYTVNTFYLTSVVMGTYKKGIL